MTYRNGETAVLWGVIASWSVIVLVGLLVTGATL